MLISLLKFIGKKNTHNNENIVHYKCMTPIGGSGGGGRARHMPPLQDQILSFLHTFLPKSTHVGGPHPPQWVHAPPPTGNPGPATDTIVLHPFVVVI